MNHDDLHKFNEILWGYYARHGRHDLPWRITAADGSHDPYKVMVSEIMLQQTQVQRVIPKFNEFLMKFPTVEALAGAELGAVLTSWSGLGYNRRAKFLWQAAHQVVTEHGGVFPATNKELVALPGIGVNTAGAILAYAFNQPAIFIETNVRTVYIHHFFADQTAVSDKAITELIEATIDTENPREFYWALMDYGTHLKQTVGNLSRQSKTYIKQSRFEGSRRQIRGAILRKLADGGATLAQLQVSIPDDRLPSVLADLLKEQLLTQKDGTYHL